MLGGGSCTWRLDQALYDAGLALVERPADERIVIVAIDDESLAALGRWPWGRGVHAALIERIAAAKPRSIGVDIGFTEADTRDPQGDLRLAQAIARAPGLVLPVLIEGTKETLPLAELRRSARLSHVSIRLDPDGIVRSVDLQRDSADGKRDYMARAMLAAAGPLPERSANLERLDIAYAGPPGHFRRIPAARVVRGEVDDAAFAGRHVLIGTTATGLGDKHSTPSTVSGGPMPGVEITANVLENLLTGRRIARLPQWGIAVFSALAALALLAGYLRLGPRRSLWASLALAFGSVVTAFALLGIAHLWFAPLTLLFTALVAYPLWSWRRLEAAARYLDEELARLRAEVALPAQSRRSGSDYLEDRIGAVRAAVGRLRSARRFVTDSLDGLSDAAFVTTLKGDIALANRLAFELCGADLAGKPLASALAVLEPQGGSWEDALRAALAGESRTLDARSADGKEFVARLAPFRDGDDAIAGTIAILEEVTALRQAEREREDTLSFVSHDLRSPQASILALTELQRLGAGLPEAQFLERIERLAWKTTNLAEDFVHVTRADSKPLALAELDLAELAENCAQDIAPQAEAKHITLERRPAAAPVLVHADRTLVSRAITNLVSNAIKYSTENTRVTITTEQRDAFVVCTISDQGVGISDKDKARLFQAFQRIESAGRATRAKGIGLGLVFVETVARRHGGRVTLESVPGEGSSFALWLPATSAAPAG